MPPHDWTRVDPGTFHSFQLAWVVHLKEALNTGLLPGSYYALSEEHFDREIADVLTLRDANTPGIGGPPPEGTALAEVSPWIRARSSPSPDAAYRALRKTLAIRRESGHCLAALVEIASPGNKDRATSVSEFVGKVVAALHLGIPVLVVDLFPPGPHDPTGLPGAVRDAYGDRSQAPPVDRPLSLASFRADRPPESFLEFAAVGELLPEMPLFLDVERYIPLPLEPSYNAAYRGLPAFWRGVLEEGHAT